MTRISTHGFTGGEPRRPVRLGGVMLDLSLTVVFVAVVVLQQLVTVV